jgi:hypothetical protein
MMRHLSLCLFVSLLLTGCAALSQIRPDFDKTYEGYNQLIRWHDMYRAAGFASSAVSREYAEWAEASKKVRISDYRVVNVKYDEKALKAEVDTVFDYYLIDSPVVKSVTDRQMWTYRDENGVKQWRLQSPPPQFK